MPGPRLDPTPERLARIVELRRQGLRWEAVQADIGVCVIVMRRWCRDYLDPGLLAEPTPPRPTPKPPAMTRLSGNSPPLPAGHEFTWGVISNDPWPGVPHEGEASSALTGRGAGRAGGQSLREDKREPTGGIIPTRAEKAKADRIFWSARRTA